MMRIFDELKEAEWMLENGFRNGFNSFSIGIVAKYYRYIGLEENEIKNKTFEFCKNFTPSYNSILDDPVIISQLKKSKKHTLRIPIDITITENELKIIKDLHNYRYEKFLFTMLVLAKYEKFTNVSNKEILSKEYYVGQNPTTIYRLSHTSKKKNEDIKHILHKKDLIAECSDLMKYDDNIRFLLKFTDTNDISKDVITITNINDIIQFYPPYCEICGKDIEKNSNSHRLCKDCYSENKKISKRNYMRKVRNVEQ